MHTMRLRPLAGHEVSRIVSCVVAKHADETAYSGNNYGRDLVFLATHSRDTSLPAPSRQHNNVLVRTRENAIDVRVLRTQYAYTCTS